MSMEWLSVALKAILMVIRWSFIIIFFFSAIILAVLTLFSAVAAYDEREMYKGKDDSWKFFIFIAIILGVLSCMFTLFGYLLI